MTSLADAEKESLSSEQMNRALGGSVHIITYPQLATFNSIDDLLSPSGMAIILWLNKTNSGHWRAIFMGPEANTVNVWDSYGLPICGELKFIPEHFAKISGETKDLLTNLLDKSGYNVTHNTYKLQSFAPNMDTCGRWCIVRLKNRGLTNAQFAKQIKDLAKSQGRTPDDICTELTADI